MNILPLSFLTRLIKRSDPSYAGQGPEITLSKAELRGGPNESTPKKVWWRSFGLSWSDQFSYGVRFCAVAITYPWYFLASLWVLWTCWKPFFDAYGSMFLLHPAFVTSSLWAGGSVIFCLYTTCFSPALTDPTKLVPEFFPDSLRVTPSGLLFSWKTSTGHSSTLHVAWSWIQTARIKTLRYMDRKQVDVIELYLDKMPKSVAQYKALALLADSALYVDPITNRKPICPEHGRCLRLPLSLFGFASDAHNLFAALKDRLNPENFGPEFDSYFDKDDVQSFTSLWLADLKGTSAPSPARVLPTGHSLGNGTYSIRNVLGCGGFSVVYEANQCAGQNQSEKVVAVKELVLNFGGTKGSREANAKQVLAEVAILRQLDHPNVVRIIDFFTEASKLYIVMEKIEGQNLREYGSEMHPLPESEIRNIAVQCCSVLSYLHSRPTPVLHRDFAPDNLMLCDGTVKVIDFNVAQKAMANASSTIVGKHCYMAPEQFCGEFTASGDLYQLGCTLYFLATGQDPEPLTQLDPSVLRGDLSKHLCSIIQKLTSRNPEERYICADDVAYELRDLVTSSKQSQGEFERC